MRPDLYFPEVMNGSGNRQSVPGSPGGLCFYAAASFSISISNRRAKRRRAPTELRSFLSAVGGDRCDEPKLLTVYVIEATNGFALIREFNRPEHPYSFVTMLPQPRVVTSLALKSSRSIRVNLGRRCCAITTLRIFCFRSKDRARIQPEAESTLGFAHRLVGRHCMGETLLLLSCGAAFITGLAIAAASLFG
jgi:hypothetical protein